jgi:hypothetical protein
VGVKKIAALLAATAIMVALAVPTVAAAKAHDIREPSAVDVEIQGKATNGFTFDFSTPFRRADNLTLTKRISQAGVQVAFYEIRSRGGAPAFDGNRLDARIAGLGRFRGRFLPTSTKTEQPDKRCSGDPTITEKGFFVGSFSFHGERGYTTVDSHRERGTVIRQGAVTCRAQAPAKTSHHRRPARPTKSQRQREEGEFRMIAGTADAHLLFQAQREESPEPEEGSPTTFLATVERQTGRLRVTHAAVLFDVGAEDAATFLTPNTANPLAEATLTPPAPFSGSATFHLEGPRTASWTGDLAVELAGLGTVPLTGADVEAALCKGSSDCTKTVSGELKTVLEFSGGGSDGSYFTGKATSEPAR